MNFDQNSLKRTVDEESALPLQTLLHEQYRVTDIEGAMSFGLIYTAAQNETAEQVRVFEFFPEQLAKRSEDHITICTEDAEAFQSRKEFFLTAAQKLSAHTVPYLPAAVCFEEHGTAYCVFPQKDGTSLVNMNIPITPTYLRSIGIALCEAYQALHELELCFGRITAEDILVHADGSISLHPAKIFASASEPFRQSLDMHCLISFLSLLFETHCQEYSDAEFMPSSTTLRNVLRYRYRDAALLKNALICADGSLEKPQTARAGAKPFRRAVLCVLFLAAGLIGIFALSRYGLPLQLSKDLGLIRPDVISVWMPMEEWADETEMQEMYHKLTVGFERKYPGFGVDLIIYADNSFPDALKFDENDTSPPTVFMNTQDPLVQEMAADLSPLMQSLEDSYLADMSGFETSVPLGCSLPALYYYRSADAEPQDAAIDYTDIASNICYDASTADFVALVEGGSVRKESTFSIFLENRNGQPILASTACLAIAERNAIASGAVGMQPVSVDGTYPLQYELYCSINRNEDWNSQRIGMLWLQYLLTEEAQQILFAEHYSVLPLHEDVLPQTLENHDALSVIEDIRTDIDTTALQ